MADAEDLGKSPADSVGDEGGHSGVGKGNALKDKECQYCHQAFTSSSLGRHLDQYLFKKKPDGIHDVEEIRRIRSSITRRQARSSTKHGSPDIGVRKGPNDSPSGSSHELPARPREGPRFLFNTPSWHATGVINDIPEKPSQDTNDSSRAPASHSQATSTSNLDFANRNSKNKDADTVRALELALQEVLDNIKAATSTSRARLSPFDFDVQAETFPSLVIKLLPPPPTLFATRPFASSTSFPIEPPGVGQVDMVRHALRTHVQQWRDEQQALSTSSQAGSKSKHFSDPNLIGRTAQQHEEMGSRHLDLAYQNWMMIPAEAKKEAWQLELTRAFVRESEKRKDLEGQLARVQQEANQLRAQVERLGSCQWPREFALFPPDTLPLPRDAARELDSLGSDINSAGASRWDYDHLLAKWKRIVMHDKSMGRNSSYRGNDELVADSSLHSKVNPLPTSENHGEFPSFGFAAHSSGSMANQQTSSYDLAHQNNTLNTHQAKRQRLMNGSGNEAGTLPENEPYKSSPQLANGNTTGWSPGSVQSLLSSTNPPATSVPAHTNRYGAS